MDARAQLMVLCTILLREGRNWSPERTQEYVAAARKLYELVGPTVWGGTIPDV